MHVFSDPLLSCLQFNYINVWYHKDAVEFWLRRIISNIKVIVLVFCFRLCLIRHYSPSTNGNRLNYPWSADITGIPPPPQRAGRTLGLNLDYAGVSLSTVQVLAKQSITDCFMANHSRSLPLMLSFWRITLTDPQEVTAFLPMLLSLVTSEQLTYLNCWIFSFQRPVGR